MILEFRIMVRTDAARFTDMRKQDSESDPDRRR